MSTPAVFKSPWPQAIAPTPLSEIKDGAWNLTTSLNGSTLIHDKLASQINPAVGLDPARVEEWGKLRAELSNHAIITPFDTADGVRLEGAFFPGDCTQAILFALGAGGCFEAVANPDDPAHDFVRFFREDVGSAYSVFVINTRGIHSNTLPSIQGCALDYYAAWSFLESKGLSVLPWGHSLGFRYVVQAAAWKQMENPQEKINIVSDRSFDSIANEAKCALGKGVKGNAAGLLMQYAGWGGGIQKEWNSLKGKKLILVAPQETTVPYEASLYKRIQANVGCSNAAVIKLRGIDRPHVRSFSKEETEAILTEVLPMLDSSLKPSKHPLKKAVVYKPKPQVLDDRAVLLIVMVVGVVLSVMAPHQK
jgi:hypothetical protein